MDVHPTSSQEETIEHKKEAWNTSKFPDAKKLRDDRAKELRAEGWEVKTKKFNFSSLGTGVSYLLEATRPRKEKLEVG